MILAAILAAVGALAAVLYLGAVHPPFSKDNFEVNYTVGGFIATPEGRREFLAGWMVAGSGPQGNYTYGVLMGMRVEAASEGGVLYARVCGLGACVRLREAPPLELLLSIKTDVLKPLGGCRALGYSGVLYGGSISQGIAVEETPWSIAGQLNVTACVVNGVPLWIRVASAGGVNGGEAYYAALEINATRAGPFDEQTYRKILAEVK